MDTSARRCFLEVYTDGCDEPRLLQLEPTVKFHNVLRRFDEDGDLYWGDHRIDPQTTPVAVGMDCGVDKANTLWFIPALSRTKPCGVSRVDSTAPLDSPPRVDATEGPALRSARGTSLPAYFDDRAAPWHSSGHHAERGSLIGARMGSASAATTPSWYSRPRLLSPVPLSLPRPTVRLPHTQAHGSEKIAPMRRLYAAPVPRVPSPPHSAVPVRRNAPVCIDPHVLVDDTFDAVQALQTELRHLSSEIRAMRLRDPLDYSSVTPMRQVVVRPPGMDAAPALASPICLSMAEPSVEELATELHHKQMHRLYEQRRLYITHDFHV
ncbi:hypothetical protein, conserved [Leishmania donovani]|uniref:Uncharacterized protein n=1 Tax=Leishmania donovani TaxID=5661 RepID=A0A3S7X5H0_LEIDO|nr:hypothetical protein, conserved [Leishmania donovani]AYU81692.1 hypothetical protein LdCL_320020100 [Leishmania donovani]TPP43656.1 hypothetical protein CGC21_20275 [Leishmania donovani]CBZ36875.1 hypothetical protein, conserved [Leishmania donovani]